MTFIWPEVLWGLALLPLLVALYLWLLHRRRRHSVRLASIAVAKAALGKGPGWRRHVPPALLLLAIGCLIVGMARPLAVSNSTVLSAGEARSTRSASSTCAPSSTTPTPNSCCTTAT